MWWARCRSLLRSPHAAFLAAMIASTTALQLLGGLSTLVLHPLLEVPLLLYLFSLLLGAMRPGRASAWIAGSLLALAYVLHDAYFLALGAVFRLADLDELPELLQVLTWLETALVLTVLLGPLLLVLSRVDLRRLRHTAIGLLPIALLIGSTRFVPESFLDFFAVVGTEVVWSDASTVKRSGRLVTLLLREAQRNAAHDRSMAFRDRDAYAAAAREQAAELAAHMRPRPVHVVVLESLLDPTLLKNVTFSRDPRHPDYIDLFGDQVGLSISPVFGSRTAQAEFEVMCGVPALSVLTSVEFNAFTGAPAHCLPDILAQVGYRTSASNGYRPNFFNAIKAYRGMGFADIYFPREYASQRDTYLTAAGIVGDEEYIFDGDLFAQHRGFLGPHTDAPALDYLLTIYGHHPFAIDADVRPDVVTITDGPEDIDLLRITNQFWYRTGAIAHHVRALIARDPESIIVLVSDHLPLLGASDSYTRLGYLGDLPDAIHHTRMLVVVDGRPVVHSGPLHHYDVPSMIYDYLTDGWYCTTHACNLDRETRPKAEYQGDYMRLMANAADSP